MPELKCEGDLEYVRAILGLDDEITRETALDHFRFDDSKFIVNHLSS